MRAGGKSSPREAEEAGDPRAARGIRRRRPHEKAPAALPDASLPRRVALPGPCRHIRKRPKNGDSVAAKKYGATLFAKPRLFIFSVYLCVQCRAPRAIFSIIKSS